MNAIAKIQNILLTDQELPQSKKFKCGFIDVVNQFTPKDGELAVHGPDNVCIVDDDPYQLKIMGLMLQYMNTYKTFAFNNVDHAWTYTLLCRPSVIVCDWCMKPMDGLVLLKRVRSHKLTRSIPFLMVTADATDQNCRLALEAGADDFLAKPFSLADFRDAVANVARAHPALTAR